jgi:Chlorophyll A-B binding protein
MLVQEFVHLPGGTAFSEGNPVKAVAAVPVEGWIQIITTISIIELATFKRTYEKGADLGFDPLGKKNFEMEVKEVKNARLAMLGAIGMIFQTMVFGDGPIAQLSHLGSVYPRL